MNIVERIDEIDGRLKKCEDWLRRLREMFDKVQGQPIIRATSGAQLVLNDSLDVSKVMTQLNDIEKVLKTL